MTGKSLLYFLDFEFDQWSRSIISQPDGNGRVVSFPHFYARGLVSVRPARDAISRDYSKDIVATGFAAMDISFVDEPAEGLGKEGEFWVLTDDADVVEVGLKYSERLFSWFESIADHAEKTERVISLYTSVRTDECDDKGSIDENTDNILKALRRGRFRSIRLDAALKSLVSPEADGAVA